MTNDELAVIIDAQRRAANSFSHSQLSSDRAKSLDYYLGKPFGNEVEGQSQVISTDVFDTVEGMLPSLLEIFTSSNRIVEAEPVGPEDEKQARQQTEAVNYVLFKQNNAPMIFYTWFKDALLQKVGVVKYYYEEEDEYRIENYGQLNEEELQMLLSDDRIEPIEQTEYEQNINGVMLKLFDVKVRVRHKRDKICVKNIAPENFFISARMNSLEIQETDFACHDEKLTKTDLLEMGFSEKELEDVAGDDELEYTEERISRDIYSDTFAREPWRVDDAMREINCSDAYIVVDFDGDGKGELRRVFKAGKTILINEEADHIPFAVLCPIPLPHQFYGLSIADVTQDVQFNKSVLLRQQLNNLYLTNNPRHAVIEGQVNLDDILTSRPGGIIRQKVAGAVTPIVTPFVAKESFPMLEYWESIKENRTGVTRYNQGLDSDSLNKTAHGISQIMTAAMKRQELIARVFAESGVKNLCKGILKVMSSSGMKGLVIKLTNGYMSVDPREWKNQYNITINVGLGTGTKDRQLQMLGMVSTKQLEMMQTGRAYMVSDQNQFAVASKMAEAAGFKSPEIFFTPPEAVPPQAKVPPPNPEMVKLETDTKLKVADMQATTQAKQADMKNERAIEEMKARIKAESDIAVANIQKEKDVLVAQIKAQVERELATVDVAKQDKELRSKAEIEVFHANTEKEKTDMESGATENREKADMMGQLMSSIMEQIRSVGETVAKTIQQNKVVATQVKKQNGKVVATIKKYADGSEEEIPNTTIQ